MVPQCLEVIGSNHTTTRDCWLAPALRFASRWRNRPLVKRGREVAHGSPLRLPWRRRRAETIEQPARRAGLSALGAREAAEPRADGCAGAGWLACLAALGWLLRAWTESPDGGSATSWGPATSCCGQTSITGGSAPEPADPASILPVWPLAWSVEGVTGPSLAVAPRNPRVCSPDGFEPAWSAEPRPRRPRRRSTLQHLRPHATIGVMLCKLGSLVGGVAVVVLSLYSSSARALSCANVPLLVPAPGSVDVATDASVWCGTSPVIDFEGWERPALEVELSAAADRADDRAVMAGAKREIHADWRQVAILTPEAELLPFTEYEVRCNGYPQAPGLSWTFTTGAGPTSAPPALPDPLELEAIASRSHAFGLSIGVRVPGLLERGTVALLDLGGGAGFDPDSLSGAVNQVAFGWRQEPTSAWLGQAACDRNWSDVAPGSSRSLSIGLLDAAGNFSGWSEALPFVVPEVTGGDESALLDELLAGLPGEQSGMGSGEPSPDGVASSAPPGEERRDTTALRPYSAASSDAEAVGCHLSGALGTSAPDSTLWPLGWATAWWLRRRRLRRSRHGRPR